MTVFLRQSTAVDVAIGPFLDAGDAVTAESSLTISQADVRLKKNNGNWAQVNDSTAATHEENGWYEKELDATDTNTVGRLLIAVHESGALPVWHEFWVLEEAIYDALFAGSANAFSGAAGSTTLTALASGSITATVIATDAIDADAIADNAINAGAIAADAITAAKLASDVATEINAGVLAVLGALNDAAADGAVTTTDTMVAYLKQLINTLEGAPGMPTWPAAAAPANGVSIAEGLRWLGDQVGTAGAGLTAADDAVMTRIGAPVGASISADVAAVKAQTAAIETDTAEIGAAGAGLTEAGGTGDQLTAIPWNAAWDAEVQSEATDALNAYDPPTKAELDSGLAGLNDLSAAEVNAEVVDALATDTYAEPGQGSPAAMASIATKVGYLYKAFRNRQTQTSSEWALYADDGSTKDQEASLTDDGTTATRGEVQTGA